jgi:REP element-mobilizing transposase RayT
LSGTTRTGGVLSGRLERVASAAGFRVHAWLLMSNHYHLLLETPEANLARGMGWLQNAYTRRINTRHRLWGHLFGGRYKAILVEPGNCFWALLDYIHLNPVRAGVVHERDGLEAFGWSSLAAYVGWPSKRPEWLETDMGFSVVGCKDNAGGRREFLGCLRSAWTGRSRRTPACRFQRVRENPICHSQRVAPRLVVRFSGLSRENAALSC